VGDLNGDGYPDIAVANRGMTSYICFNDGKLHFKCNPLRNTPSPASILIADMDKDGKNDVIFPCRDNCQSRVFFNRDLAGEGRPWGPANASIRAIAVADLDGDGHPDIAACPEGLGCFVYMISADLNGDGHPDLIVGYVNAPGVIYFNDGTGRNFVAHRFGDGKGAIYGMASGDLNGDGRLDLVAARSDAPSFILFNRGSD